MSQIPTLPQTKAPYRFMEPLAAYTTFRIGGAAEVFFKPQDIKDLAYFWQNKPHDVDITILGEGSNVLVRDGGIKGVVVHIGRGCDKVEVDGTKIYAQAGASTGKVARMARNAGLSGVEFICGVPGSMGGALVMNAGCYGHELCDILEAVDVIDNTGEIITVDPKTLGFGYRKSNLPEGWLFVAAHLALKAGDKSQVRQAMREINQKRTSSQPLELPNAGSLFKNPEGQKAWQLIQESGCRGLRKGDAQVSEKHSNFFVNLGNATACDMENLAEEVREKVYQKTGTQLEWEVRLLGDR